MRRAPTASGSSQLGSAALGLAVEGRRHGARGQPLRRRRADTGAAASSRPSRSTSPRRSGDADPPEACRPRPPTPPTSSAAGGAADRARRRPRRAPYAPSGASIRRSSTSSLSPTASGCSDTGVRERTRALRRGRRREPACRTYRGRIRVPIVPGSPVVLLAENIGPVPPACRPEARSRRHSHKPKLERFSLRRTISWDLLGRRASAGNGG